MLVDVTVDTNVFMHAADPRQALMQEALDFVQVLLNSTTLIVVDAGFHPVESQNRSAMWSEYMRFVPSQSVSGIVLATLAANGRISEAEVSVSGAQAKDINRLVTDRTDRVFMKAAMNSIEKVLVSHDDLAFKPGDRKQTKSKLAVVVANAAEAVALM